MVGSISSAQNKGLRAFIAAVAAGLLVMSMMGLMGCGGQKKTEEKKEETSQEASSSSSKSTESSSESKPDEKPAEKPAESSSGTAQTSGLRAEFKEAMDAYEKFVDEYVAFMQKYKANPTDKNLLSEYSKIVQRSTDMTSKFQNWKSNNLNKEELKYYLDLSSRMTKKMLDVAS